MNRTVVGLLFCALAAACNTSVDDPFSEPEPSDIELALEGGQRFTFAAQESAGELNAKGVFTGEYNDYTLDIAGGSAEVSLIDGKLMLTSLTIEVSGLAYELPGGSLLDEMVLVLEEPTELTATWDDGSVSSRSELELRLDWWVETATGPVSLASQTVEAVPIELTIEETESGLVLAASLREEGDVLTVDSVIDVSKIDVTLAGST